MTRTASQRIGGTDPWRVLPIPSSGTHDTTDYLALRLADSLEERTDHMTIWIGTGERFGPFQEFCDSEEESVGQCAEALEWELCDARNVAR